MSTKRAVYDIAEFKAVTDKPGQFTALVSAFGNVDLQGDRIVPGAFAKSLDRWKTSGNPIPIVWSHDWQDPFAHIGEVTSAAETAKGLQITGTLDIAKPFAAQVHDLLKSRRVTGMSFAYDVINEHTAKDGANELTELGLIEVGPTLKGANPDAQLINAKALLEEAATKARLEDGEKAGRRLSQATQTEMQSIRDSAAALIAQMDALMGVAEDATPTSSEEPDGAKTGDTDLETIETETDETATESPTAKSTDETITRLRTRVAEMRATTGIPA